MRVWIANTHIGSKATLILFTLYIFLGLIVTNYYYSWLDLYIFLGIIASIGIAGLIVNNGVFIRHHRFVDGKNTYDVLDFIEPKNLKKSRRVIVDVFSRAVPTKKFLFIYKPWPYLDAFRVQIEKRFHRNTPDKILLLGGGSAFGFYLQSMFPGAVIEAVELSRNMIRVCKKYFWKPESPSKIINAEGMKYLKKTKNKYDLIIVDVFSNSIVPKNFKSANFAKLLKLKLNKGGVFCMNFGYKHGDSVSFIVESLKKTLPKFHVYFSGDLVFGIAGVSDKNQKLGLKII